MLLRCAHGLATSGRVPVACTFDSGAKPSLMADVLGRPVLASSEPQGSSRGAALLALEMLGYLDSPLESLEPEIRARFEPVPEHTRRYGAAAERQRHLYD